MIEIDPADFARVVKEISQVDPSFKKVIKKRLKTAAEPVVEEVKRAALSIPAKGGDAQSSRKKKGESLGLRASLAAATISDINPTKKGAILKIRISTTRFMAASGRPRSIPYYMEGRRKRDWRHPVFGNRENWVIQKSHPFLAVTVLPHKMVFAKEVVLALEEALKDSGLLNSK